MSDADEPFETTVERLEVDRERAEGEYFRLLDRLRDRLTRLPAAAAAAQAAAREAEQDRPDVTPLAPLSTSAPGAAVAWTAARWPRATGTRGVLNRIVRWALRDYLEVLDRRHDSAVQSAAAQAAASASNLEGMAALAERQQVLAQRLARLSEAQARLHTLVEATRALAAGLGEVVELAEGGAEQLRLLADFKNAETLQRAVAGPLRRMDLLFDEVERQQEALLAELVGKRVELDALVAGLRREPGE